MSSKQGPKVPPLTKGPVPLAPLREKARAKFLDIIDVMIGPAFRQSIALVGFRLGAKALVVDPTLDGCLALIIPAAVLSEHGVEEMFHLGPELQQPASKSVIFIVQPLPHMKKGVYIYVACLPACLP